MRASVTTSTIACCTLAFLTATNGTWSCGYQDVSFIWGMIWITGSQHDHLSEACLAPQFLCCSSQVVLASPIWLSHFTPSNWTMGFWIQHHRQRGVCDWIVWMWSYIHTCDCVFHHWNLHTPPQIEHCSVFTDDSRSDSWHCGFHIAKYPMGQLGLVCTTELWTDSGATIGGGLDWIDLSSLK